MANKTKGTLLQISISTVYTTIANRVTVTPAEGTRNKIETTDLDDDAETSVSGIERGGEYTVEGNYDPGNATHAYLWSSFKSGTDQALKLVLANAAASEADFTAWLSGFQIGAATVDGYQKFTAKMQVTGEVTITAAPA
jgi:hypothetical protein